VAVLKVGAATETEMKYVKLKIEDAVAATKAALAEGIVPGGGIALFKLALLMQERKSQNQTLEEQAAIATLTNALGEPLAQISANSGKKSGEIATRISQKLHDDPKSNAGYDLSRMRFLFW
jgi:chaperonin GroEL